MLPIVAIRAVGLILTALPSVAGTASGSDGPPFMLASPLPGSATGAAFVAPERPWGRGHRGLDFTAAPGQPVSSPVRGIVRFAGMVAGRGVLTIEPAAAPSFRITLEPVDPRIARGQRVEPGTPVGRVGRGGHCDTRCLHLGVKGPVGYLDPWPLLTDRGPVLKPP